VRAAQPDFSETGELLLFINESQLAFLEDAMWAHGYLATTQMAGAFQLLRSNDLVWSRMVREYIRTPAFAVGTETDHVAPWRSVRRSGGRIGCQSAWTHRISALGILGQIGLDNYCLGNIISAWLK
jgi:poly(3-hydroxyalkanoate) synthetase